MSVRKFSEISTLSEEYDAIMNLLESLFRELKKIRNADSHYIFLLDKLSVAALQNLALETTTLPNTVEHEHIGRFEEEDIPDVNWSSD